MICAGAFSFSIPNAMLEIFARLNSSGTKLMPADLLYAQISTYAKEDVDVRGLFDDFFKNLNYSTEEKINFEINHYIRLLWLIFGNDTTSFRTFNNAKTMQYHSTKQELEDVYKALMKAKTVYIDNKFNFKGKPAYNMFLPIAYYFYYTKDCNFTEDEEATISAEIAKYYEVSISSGYFGGQSDTYLLKAKKVLGLDKNTNSFTGFTNNVFDFKYFKFE